MLRLPCLTICSFVNIYYNTIVEPKENIIVLRPEEVMKNKAKTIKLLNDMQEWLVISVVLNDSSSREGADREEIINRLLAFTIDALELIEAN
jgi:hypothetical protein